MLPIAWLPREKYGRTRRGENALYDERKEPTEMSSPYMRTSAQPSTEPTETHDAQSATPVERIYFEWDKALANNDAETLTALYAEDAVIESPLIPHVLAKKDGVCRGRQEIRLFFDEVARRKPTVRQVPSHRILDRWKAAHLGIPTLRVDFVESMEVNDKGLIQRHCVYWGWFGFGVLERNEYHR